MRASGVISSHAARDFGFAVRAFCKSAGSLCGVIRADVLNEYRIKNGVFVCELLLMVLSMADFCVSSEVNRDRY